MSTGRTCNRSFWTKEEDKIFENTLAIYFKDDNLFKKMAEALPGKSHDDIIYHYDILLEDLNSIESGHVPLPNYPEMQSDSNQKSRISKADVVWRRGIPWTEEEHSYFSGAWRNLDEVIGPAFGGSQAVPSTNNESMLPRESTNAGQMIAVAGGDITSAGAEGAGTSQVQNTEDRIGPVCGGSQAVPSTNNESILPRESTNAEWMIAVAGGESSGHNAAFVDGMNGLCPDVNDEFILSIDDPIMEQEDANEAGERSLLPSKQTCTAASSGTDSRPINH